jgi:hypothetical protein
VAVDVKEGRIQAQNSSETTLRLNSNILNVSVFIRKTVCLQWECLMNTDNGITQWLAYAPAVSRSDGNPNNHNYS